MDKEELANKAVQFKLSGKYNCCQAVMQALKEEVNVDEDTLIKLGSGFAFGMGTGRNSSYRRRNLFIGAVLFQCVSLV